VIVLHVDIATHPEYLTRREPHRRAHIERLAGLRQVGAVIGGGPAPDGSRVEIVYRLQQPAQLKPAIEEDPYWVGGAWTGYRERSFSEFVEPWRLPEIVLDGSRRRPGGARPGARCARDAGARAGSDTRDASRCPRAT